MRIAHVVTRRPRCAARTRLPPRWPRRWPRRVVGRAQIGGLSSRRASPHARLGSEGGGGWASAASTSLEPAASGRRRRGGRWRVTLPPRRFERENIVQAKRLKG